MSQTLPIGQLMIEHRLIERMIALLAQERERLMKKKDLDSRFIENVVDFIQTYADRCHHGKEEDILFHDLMAKELSPQHLEVLERLVKEHAQARKVTGELAKANERYVAGETAALNDIVAKMDELISFYPRHIESEDNDFFIPCMEYFSEEEKKRMNDQFADFDRKLIHEAYDKLITRLEERSRH